MELSPHLNFDGQCAEAFAFYAQCLAGRIAVVQRHGDPPTRHQVPPHWREKVLHARLILGRSALTGCDVLPGWYISPQGIAVTLSVPPADAERIFKALARGGRITMPFEETFWSAGSGRLVDRFGVPWTVQVEPGP
jgi:PhnB protein